MSILLILDNRSSHVSIQTISKAKENGTVMLTIPPHTSHQLQHLDVSIYGPLKAYYNQAADDWMRNNHDQTIRIFNVSEFIKDAAINALTPRNILSGFQTTGIDLLNSGIFKEPDFVAAEIMDRPEPMLQIRYACRLNI